MTLKSYTYCIYTNIRTYMERWINQVSYDSSEKHTVSHGL